MERKWKKLEQGEQPRKKAKKEPRCGKRPIIRMILHWGNQKKLVKVLLDTGCSVPLVSQWLAREEDLPWSKREEPAPLRSCSGDVIPGSREEVTEELTLQHRQHFTQKIFDVTPMESEVDIFLPFWWIARRPL